MSVLLEFLEDLPEPREAGLSHTKDGEPAPHLPEVGGPTAPQSAQQVHLLSNIPHQEVASLAVEEPEGDTEMTQGHLLRAGLCPRPQEVGIGEMGRDTVLKLSAGSQKKQTRYVAICDPRKGVTGSEERKYSSS